MKAFWTAIIFLWGAASCSKEPETLPADALVQLSGTIAGTVNAPESPTGVRATHPATRTSMSGNTASFVSTDKIGVSETLSGRTNVLFTYNGTAWSTTTPMYWYNGTSTHTFYAYYPYNASNQGNLVAIPLLNSQTFNTTPDITCDMLISGPKTQVYNANETNVPLTFTHAFSLLQFNITQPLINTYVLKKLTINGGNTGGGTPYGIVNIINTVPQVGYNLTAQSVQAASNSSATYATTITKDIPPGSGLIGSTSTVYAIILPGNYTAPLPSVQLQVSSVLGGNQTTELGMLPNTQFKPGTKYVYSMQIGGIIARSATKADSTPEAANPIELTCILSDQSI